jgi:hypothetical protein
MVQVKIKKDQWLRLFGHKHHSSTGVCTHSTFRAKQMPRDANEVETTLEQALRCLETGVCLLTSEVRAGVCRWPCTLQVRPTGAKSPPV